MFDPFTSTVLSGLGSMAVSGLSNALFGGGGTTTRNPMPIMPDDPALSNALASSTQQQQMNQQSGSKKDAIFNQMQNKENPLPPVPGLPRELFNRR